MLKLKMMWDRCYINENFEQNTLKIQRKNSVQIYWKQLQELALSCRHNYAIWSYANW